MSRAGWQKEFDAIRIRYPTQWNRWVRPDIIVVPSWVARLYGGTFLWLGWFCVGRYMLGAPFYARRYLVALQWAQVARGHLLATIGLLLCLGGMYVAMNIEGDALLGWLVGVGGFGLMAWFGSPTRLFEVDDEMAEFIGRRSAIAGLRWQAKQTPGLLDRVGRRRLVRLSTAASVPPRARGASRSAGDP